MSVEINQAEEYKGVELNRGNELNEINEPIDSKYKTEQKSALNAKDVAMNLIKKTNEKKQGVNEAKEKTRGTIQGHNEEKDELNQSSKTLTKKGLVGLLGDIAKGVLGSSKKQQEELRRLEAEVKVLDKDNGRLDSLLKTTSLDSISSQFDSILVSEDEGSVLDIDDQHVSVKENELIDDRSKINMKKSDKLDRISQLRKKGVK